MSDELTSWSQRQGHVLPGGHRRGNRTELPSPAQGARAVMRRSADQPQGRCGGHSEVRPLPLRHVQVLRGAAGGGQDTDPDSHPPKTHSRPPGCPWPAARVMTSVCPCIRVGSGLTVYTPGRWRRDPPECFISYDPSWGRGSRDPSWGRGSRIPSWDVCLHCHFTFRERSPEITSRGRWGEGLGPDPVPCLSPKRHLPKPEAPVASVSVGQALRRAWGLSPCRPRLPHLKAWLGPEGPFPGF